MYCSKCGALIPDNGVCPNCAQAPQPAIENPAPETVPVSKTGSGKITKGSKTYAALLTAAMVFPASLSVAIDLSFHNYDFWFGYVVGAIFVAWVCLVLPAMRVTPAPVTALICFASIVGYVFFVLYKLGHVEWLYQRALPLFILFAIFVSIDAAVAGRKNVNWMSLLSLISFEIGVYLVAIEATYTRSLENLHWSPILACGFISVAAVFVAFAYIGKINKK